MIKPPGSAPKPPASTPKPSPAAPMKPGQNPLPSPSAQPSPTDTHSSSSDAHPHHAGGAKWEARHRAKYFINTKCTECGACMERCPTKSIFLGVSQLVIDSDTCDGNAVCVIFCPEDAIHKIIDE